MRAPGGLWPRPAPAASSRTGTCGFRGNAQDRQTRENPGSPGVSSSLREPAVYRNGGARGSRTPDLLNAIQALSQLSYGPAIPGALRGGGTLGAPQRRTQDEIGTSRHDSGRRPRRLGVVDIVVEPVADVVDHRVTVAIGRLVRRARDGGVLARGCCRLRLRCGPPPCRPASLDLDHGAALGAGDRVAVQVVEFHAAAHTAVLGAPFPLRHAREPPLQAHIGIANASLAHPCQNQICAA